MSRNRFEDASWPTKIAAGLTVVAAGTGAFAQVMQHFGDIDPWQNLERPAYGGAIALGMLAVAWYGRDAQRTGR